MTFSCKKTEETPGQKETIIGDALPAPFATPSANHGSTTIGWPSGKTPIAPEGFVVTRFAEKLNSPRWIYVAPNNDIFVSEAGGAQAGNDVLLFKDSNQDGIVDESHVFLNNLNRPFGMLVLNNFFYVATTDAVWRFPYSPGQNKMDAAGTKILDLPANGNHWTRKHCRFKRWVKNICNRGLE